MSRYVLHFLLALCAITMIGASRTHAKDAAFIRPDPTDAFTAVHPLTAPRMAANTPSSACIGTNLTNAQEGSTQGVCVCPHEHFIAVQNGTEMRCVPRRAMHRLTNRYALVDGPAEDGRSDNGSYARASGATDARRTHPRRNNAALAASTSAAPAATANDPSPDGSTQRMAT